MTELIFTIFAVTFLICVMITADYTYRRRIPPKFAAIFTSVVFYGVLILIIIDWLN